MKNIINYAMLFLFFSGCATGEKFSNIQSGMTVENVRNVLGSEDGMVRNSDGSATFVYQNRMVSGWSYDKADYQVQFDSKGYVIGYGRTNFYPTSVNYNGVAAGLNGLANVVAPPQQNNLTPRKVSCESRRDFLGNIITDCTEK